MPHDSLLSAYFGNHSAPHFHRHWAVGLSCLALSAPLPWLLAHGQLALAAFNVTVTLCSLVADYFAIGTVWDDVDRAVAAAYIATLIYFSALHNGAAVHRRGLGAGMYPAREAREGLPE
eukprot:jgi/Tetstr1/439677/TSEL_028096.t1